MSRIWKNSIGFSPKTSSLILAVVFAAGFIWFTDTQAAYAQAVDIDVDVSNNTPTVGETVTFTITIAHTNVVSSSAVSILSELVYPVGSDEPNKPLLCNKGPDSDPIEFGLVLTAAGVIVEYMDRLTNGTSSYTCSVEIDSETDFTNTLTYDYTGPDGSIEGDVIPLFIDVIAAPANPQIQVTKSPAIQTVEVGQMAMFTLTVENIGNVHLEDIVLSDPLAPDCSGRINDLHPKSDDSGPKIIVVCSAPITTLGSFTNTAKVTASVVGTGEIVTDTAEAFVEVTSDGGNPVPDVSISVKGMVINHEEKLVAGVPLYAQLGNDEETRIELESDVNGEFEFDIPQEGNWLFSLGENPSLPIDWMPVTSGQFYVQLSADQDGNYQIRFKIKQVRIVEVIKVDDLYNRLPGWVITASPGPGNVFAKPITATTGLSGTALFGTAVFTLTEGLWTFTEDVPVGSDITFEHVIPVNGVQELEVDTERPFEAPYTIYFKNRIIEEDDDKGGCIDIHKQDDPAGFGIQGWYVEVLRMDGSLAAMGNTDVEGNLKIENLPSGPYKIIEEERAGWQPVTPDQVDVYIMAGEACQQVTFVNEQVEQASPDFCIEGRKIDINGRYGLPGWEITIKPAVDGGFEHESDSIFTDGLGQYRFDFPSDDYRIPGSAYEICEVQQEGWVTAFTPECQIVHLPYEPDGCVVVPDFVNAQVGHDLSQYHTPTPYPTPTEIPTQIPPTATPVLPTSVPPTEVPTDTPSQPTVLPPTVTPVPPTYTPIPPTATPIPPTPVVETPTPMPMPSPTAAPTDLPDGNQYGTYGPAGKLPPASKNDGAAGYSNYDEVYPQGEGPSRTQVESHDPSCRLYHIVLPGEGLSTIAAQYSLYHKDVLGANPWVATQKNGWVYPGQQICVPSH